ncbi:hypothetical protein ACHAW5_002039 [Stephanodiscus triporus]|uniref:Nuclear pore complex protein Nup85 n=1 Tax=Stephanodiscus triporus TaxID=2934178 RepID=A0ABD3QKA6_9STRA
MSAAAARRKKQLAKRAVAAAPTSDDDVVVHGSSPPPDGVVVVVDPVRLRLDALLRDPDLTDESVAYEALQLAQSSVRRCVKVGKYDDASRIAHETCVALLDVGGRVAVSSQLLSVLVGVLNETHAPCTPAWISRFVDLDGAYRRALDADANMGPDERGRLQRLHMRFLGKVLRWSNDLGTTRHGDVGVHQLLADHCWNMSLDEAVVGTEKERMERAAATAAAAAVVDRDNDDDDDDEDEEEEGDSLDIGLRNEAVTHYALAGNVDAILSRLKSLPGPTPEELTSGHVCPPAQRDALLTRSVLTLLAIENMRGAAELVRAYLTEIEYPIPGRSNDELRNGYLDKNDGIAPCHAMFCSMLIRICEKDVKTAPLFTWLIRNFGAELGTMHDSRAARAYTTKIGRVYFDIQPPPSMMSMMENMMSTMGGGGGGGVGRGPGGGMPGGMNPAMMMQAMQAMQGGGM